VLVACYPPPVRDGEEMGVGRLAGYTWGEDYHDVLAERLQALATFLEAQVGYAIPSRWYTDTGPLLERELAQRAGLGWIGKNTCLIHPRIGSYFVLAELLLGVELEIDPPFTADRCGRCTRCIEACPTGCILPDRTLDARRCISYLTIEQKGPIPRELRPLLGNRVFGCDVCQQVCPWNPPGAVDEAVDGLAEALFPSLIAEITLTSKDFNCKYRHHSVRRAKRRGYLRNVAVALGNCHQASSVPFLTQALMADPEPLVRGHAAWALGQNGTQAARKALAEAAITETDAFVGAEIQGGLKDSD
jgi:epoxyqueuosine reductase